MIDLQTEYQRRRPSGHWFDADTMRFWGTRIGAVHWITDTGEFDTAPAVFVTSERAPSGSRLYSVRYMTQDGDIRTIGPFHALSQSQANRIARQLAEDGSAKLDGETLTLESED